MAVRTARARSGAGGEGGGGAGQCIAPECMDNLPRSGADVRMLLRDKEGGPGAASWVPPASASSAPWGIGPMFADCAPHKLLVI